MARLRHAEGAVLRFFPFHFELFIRKGSAAAAAADTAADRAEAALRNAGERCGATAAGHGTGSTAEVADENQVTTAGAGAGSSGSLILGSLLEVGFRPGEVAGREEASTQQHQRKLTRHAGHGHPLRTDACVQTRVLREYSYRSYSIFTTPEANWVAFFRNGATSGVFRMTNDLPMTHQ